MKIPSGPPEIQRAFMDVDKDLKAKTNSADVLRIVRDEIKKLPSSNSSSGLTDNPVTIDGQLYVSGYVGIGKFPSSQLELSADSATKPTSNTWTIASDARCKRNVENFTEGLSTLLKIRPVSYEYNGEFGMPEGEKSVGVIAQEAQSVVPESVTAIPYKGDSFLTFNTHRLFYIMLNAIKEMSARIDVLEAK